MMSCSELKSYNLAKLPGNNKDTVLGQFRNIDAPRDGLLNFLSESTKAAFKEQINEKKECYERECSGVLESDTTTSVQADALCFRSKQKLERLKPRHSAIKCQSIIEAIALKLRMWIYYLDETTPKF